METQTISERIAQIDTEKRALYAKWTTNGKFNKTSGAEGFRSTSDVRGYVNREYARLMTERKQLMTKLNG